MAEGTAPQPYTPPIVKDYSPIIGGTNISITTNKTVRMGNFCALCMIFSPNADITALSVIAQGLLPSYGNCAVVLVYDNTSPTSPIRCTINVAGQLIPLDALVSGHSYRLYTVYPCQ